MARFRIEKTQSDRPPAVRADDRFLVNVAADSPDLRDLIYRPMLRPLLARVDPKPLLSRIHGRDQGREGSCTAQALASVIDLMRVQGAGSPERIPMASARMLFECARYFDEPRVRTGGGDGVHSLRAALKGFYHNGVCLDRTWPYVDGKKDGQLTVERAKEAKNFALGAYYRLQPVLTDYHSAINEVGAIYVAAEIHTGWEANTVAAANGRIQYSGEGLGRHAFVVVGYDDTGFFIFNSWGARWGMFDGVPCLAHWAYTDWADSIVDGWVLQLAVSAPQAFTLGIGPQGLGAALAAPIMRGSTARAELLGHYLHLDDGVFVPDGAYPSSAESVRRTVDHLGELAAAGGPPPDPHGTKYQHVLLWLGGGIDATKDAVTDAVRLKSFWKERGVYFIIALWCSDFLGEVTKLMDAIFAAAFARVGRKGPELDQAIECEIRSVGRAAWRDVRRAAMKASAQEASGAADGAMRQSVEAIASLADRYILHLVAEGTGAILAAELFSQGDKAGERPLCSAFATVTLLSPACTRDDVRALTRICGGQCGPVIALLSPTPDAENRMQVGAYGKSILELADRAFVEHPRRDEVAGLARTAHRMRRAAEFSEAVEFESLKPAQGTGDVALRELSRGNPTLARLCKRLLGRSLTCLPHQGLPKPRYGPEL